MQNGSDAEGKIRSNERSTEKNTQIPEGEVQRGWSHTGDGSMNLIAEIPKDLLVHLICTLLPLASFAWLTYQKI